MKKHLIRLFALASMSLLASCGNTSTEYDLATHVADGEIGYVVLVGEDGNPEAEDRTKGCIAAMDAVAAKYGLKAKMLEKTTSKDGSGASWSDTQAKVLMETWVTKHGDKIDFVVSNNDGMAIAASSVQTLQKKTPIVGFDALKTACNMIVEGTLAGSVSQNGTDQAYATALVLGNLIAGKTDITEGYNGNAELNKDGVANHIVQTKLAAVTAANANQYAPGSYVTPTATGLLSGKKVLYCLYDAKDNFIGETYAKDLPHYVTALGGSYKELKGENDNSKMLESVKNANQSDSFDAYAFNIPEHSTWQEYLKIAGFEFDGTGACTKKGKPTVFFNRQPKTGSDVANLAAANLDNVYFVGTGSTGQGEVQGKVITDWFDANMKK